MDNLQSITLTFAKVRIHGDWFTAGWEKKLAQVKEESHIPCLVFFGEVLKILDKTGDISFESSGYNSSSVYGPDYDWKLKTLNLGISREHRESLSDSWQRVEVLANSLVIGGFSTDFYLDWNGKFYSPLNLTIGGIYRDDAESIKAAARRIFYNPDCRITEFSEVDKHQSEQRKKEQFQEYSRF